MLIGTNLYFLSETTCLSLLVRFLLPCNCAHRFWISQNYFNFLKKHFLFGIAIPIFLLSFNAFPILMQKKEWESGAKKLFVNAQPFILVSFLYGTYLDSNLSQSTSNSNSTSLSMQQESVASHQYRWMYHFVLLSFLLGLYAKVLEQTRSEIGNFPLPALLTPIFYAIAIAWFLMDVRRQFLVLDSFSNSSVDNASKSPRSFIAELKGITLAYMVIFVAAFCIDIQDRNHLVVGTYSLTMITIYWLLFLHIVFLLFRTPSFLQRNLVWPITLLQFLVSSDHERFYLLVFGIGQGFLISNLLQWSDINKRTTFYCGPNCRRAAFLLMINFPYLMHESSWMSYTLHGTSHAIPGFYQTGENLLGNLYSIYFALKLLQKFGYFVLAPAFYIRMVTSEIPKYVISHSFQKSDTCFSGDEKSQERLYYLCMMLSFLFASLFGYLYTPTFISSNGNLLFSSFAFAIVAGYSAPVIGNFVTQRLLSPRILNSSHNSNSLLPLVSPSDSKSY